MLVTLVLLTALFVLATTGASYYGFVGDDDVNPFLADGRWSSDAYNQVVHEHKNGNEFLAEDVDDKKFLKVGEAEHGKSRHRQNMMMSEGQVQHGHPYNKPWNKMKDTKNKKPKNKKPKHLKHKPSHDLHHVTHSPLNDDPTQAARKIKISNKIDDRVKFIHSVARNSQQMPDPYHGRPVFPPQNPQQDFFYYPPPGYYPHYNLPPLRPGYPSSYTPHQRPPMSYHHGHPHHFSPNHDQQENQFSAEGEKISMALVKAITDYLKATGDAKGLTKVVQALTAFNEIFTSPTYYGPLMDGYKKFLEKISAHSFLQSLNEDHQMNLPKVENNRKLDFQRFTQHGHQFKRRSDNTMEAEQLSRAIGDYLSTKRSTATPSSGKEDKSN